MISVLASPKSFIGDFAALQERALRSWKEVHPSVEVILYGGGHGVAQAATRYGAVHIPNVACSGSGAPLFNAMAEHARQHARHNRQIYLNADIILPPDLLARVDPVQFPRYLISGQRIDLSEGVVWDLDAGFVKQLGRLRQNGKAQPHGSSGMDYFLFPGGIWDGLKNCVIGRGGYDNALLAFCLRRKIPVVDATSVLPIVHQWHDYAHMQGGHHEAHKGQEALGNCVEHDVLHSPPSVADSDWVLTPAGLQRGNCRGDRLRWLEVQLRYRYGLKLTSYVVRAAWRLTHDFLSRGYSK